MLSRVNAPFPRGTDENLRRRPTSLRERFEQIDLYALAADAHSVCKGVRPFSLRRLCRPRPPKRRERRSRPVQLLAAVREEVRKRSRSRLAIGSGARSSSRGENEPDVLEAKRRREACRFEGPSAISAP